MYNDVKSRIANKNSLSDMFASEIGVRQGENLSPLLFSLYLNDLQQYLENVNISGVQSLTLDIENELNIYLKLFVLLYADDTILLAESSSDLQLLLNNFSQYCNNWKLRVNVSKTKVMVFTRGRISNNLKFCIENEEIEIVKHYKYLGVIFSRNASFFETRKYLRDQATKAMYSVIKKSRLNHLSIECQLEMFDKAVVPILLYGAEIWGYEKFDILERVHLKFCKHILKLKNSTPNVMIYGELGRYPISLYAKLRMINFWCRLLDNTNEDKLSCILYKLLYINYNNYGIGNKWMLFIKKIFDECGMSNVWHCQDYFNKKWIKLSIEQKLKDQFRQEWCADLHQSAKSLCYRIFKTEFKFEKYLSILPFNFLYTLCKFRCGNHRLPVETGRWQTIPRSERSCHLCSSRDIGDEFHYIMSCNFFNIEREKYLPHYCKKNANIIKFKNVFSSENVVELEKLCRFIRYISLKVCPPG